ncbi:uncharacterized protein LOC143287420 isoform X2 [Babylonia areolata]|uniref:uncharacterized protein LOC143287420 isoform X2 n=1 Tax=Babylonia areolata TaxID=304850 RepID=UPI003FD3AE00
MPSPSLILQVSSSSPLYPLASVQTDLAGAAEVGVVPWCSSQASKLADLPENSPSPHAVGTSATAVEAPARPVSLPVAAPAADPIASDRVHPSGNTRDIGIITDLCNDEDPDEVEILTLIHEQIPRYRLRSDSFANFGCYSHQDWVQTPVINLDTDLELTEEQITETLKYFTKQQAYRFVRPLSNASL